MKLKIKVTKDILQRSMYCGFNRFNEKITESCAIALAIRDIFPNAWVKNDRIIPIRNKKLLLEKHKDFISFPYEVTKYITNFDLLVYTPEERLDLPEIEFEVNIPENIIDKINIEDIKNSKTLSFASDKSIELV